MRHHGEHGEAPSEPLSSDEVSPSPRATLIHESTTGDIIAAAIEVHRHLGPGLLESAYEACLVREMVERGLSIRRQVALPVEYKGETLDIGFRIDLLVEDAVIVELKAVDAISRIHEAQLLTYLKLAKKRVGLIINFNVPVLTKGILRRVL